MRLLAIGDIHGCLLQFNDLLDLVKPEADDCVILLGDYVDRGSDTRGVLNRILELRAGGMNLICLRGNHETMMLAARDNGGADERRWLAVGGLQVLRSYGRSAGRSGTLDDIPAKHWQFLEDDLLPYLETGQRIFVHAGAYPDTDMADQPENALYWEKLEADMRHDSGKQIICGHTAQKSGEIKVVPGAVCIDTFAYGGGWLTCLDAMSGNYWQVNYLGKSRTGRIEFAP